MTWNYLFYMLVLADKEVVLPYVSRMEYGHFHDYVSEPHLSVFYMKCNCTVCDDETILLVIVASKTSVAPVKH